MSVEKENWIQNILNSADGITQLTPPDSLFVKIQRKIKEQETVPVKTIWLVAASIAALIVVNISVVNNNSKPAKDSAEAYLQMTVNQSNQLY